ncbi:MAG: DUF1599 domain-containing protein [Saprospiraceae bacterium]|nr:DUF1599 domain-containing protein [Saprospiraceae bacterium]
MKRKTEEEYKDIIEECKDLFKKKTKDYGTAWRVLRVPSITDQIFIKAQRIRSVQEKGKQKIDENISSEFKGIINYCLIAMMQIELNNDSRMEIQYEELEPLYDKFATQTHDLLSDKNHDYGEAWRDMRISSITDIILMKLLRVKQIEDNEGETIVSEGVIANYQDMINYSVFSLIMLSNEN